MGDEPTKKAARSARLGPTGEAVRANVRRLRDAQGISAAQLSKKMGQLGRPIPLVGIQRIESGERRPDADDLVTLAAALGVSPISLLMPYTSSSDDHVQILDGLDVTAGTLWRWLRADRGIPPFTGTLFEFIGRSLPVWESDNLTSELIADVDTVAQRLQHENEALIKSRMTPQIEADWQKAMELLGNDDKAAERLLVDIFKTLGIADGDDK